LRTALAAGQDLGEDVTVGTLKRSRLGAILRSTSGNFLEQFDFFLFGFYATRISAAFFPTGNEVTGLLLTFGVFWLGALMRPIGAIFLGSYVDRVGRRKGLIVALSIMATGTILIAVTPTYAQIGVAAPIIVVAGRLLQGFSAGVELGGVSIYLFEIATPGNKGFYTSFQSASQQVAIFVAALIGYALSVSLPQETSSEWGWRIPFFIGCSIIPFIFLLRRTLEETPDFLARKRHPTPGEIFASMLENRGIIALGVMIVTMTTVTFYFTTVYTPTFGKSVLKLTETDALKVTLCVATTNFLWLPIGGAISDRVGRKPVLLTIAVLSLLTANPMLTWLVAAPDFTKLLIVELVLSFYFGVYNGAMVATLSEIMPAQVRVTGFSFAFSLGVALFGSFTPWISTKLIQITEDRASPSYWLMLAAGLAIIATLLIYRKGNRYQAELPAQS
jgi:MHS family citrate/tricarballylate:H+ symporter-like MFS transporter